MDKTRFTQFSTAFLNFIVKPKRVLLDFSHLLVLTVRIVLRLFQIFQEFPLRWLSGRAAHQVFSHTKKDEKKLLNQ